MLWGRYIAGLALVALASMVTVTFNNATNSGRLAAVLTDDGHGYVDIDIRLVRRGHSVRAGGYESTVLLGGRPQANCLQQIVKTYWIFCLMFGVIAME